MLRVAPFPVPSLRVEISTQQKRAHHSETEQAAEETDAKKDDDEVQRDKWKMDREL